MGYINENVRSYEQAEKILGARASKLIGLNTKIQRNGDAIGITLHSTEVARFTVDGGLIVSTGGWNTVTTRERINRYLPQGLRVWTERGVLYIGSDEKLTRRGLGIAKKLFVDGGRVINGELVGFAEVNGQAKTVDKLRRRVAKFAEAYIAALKAGKVDAPGLGDCFYCAMRVESPDKDKGKTLGEASKSDHLDMHMRERYFVPSLITRAVEVFPVSMVANQCLAAQWAPNTSDEIKREAQTGYFYGIGWGQLEKALRRYVLRQFGIDGR